MTDVIGDYGGNHPLDAYRVEYTGSIITTNRPNGFTANGIPSGMYLELPGKLATPPPLNSYVNRLLSSTGPLTPRVNLPLFIYELKDIPMMLRHAGNLLHKIRRPSGLDPAKEGAAATLAFQFGWAPLWEDLWKLADFTEAVSKKQQQLERANSEKGLRRKVDLAQDKWTAVGSTTLWSVYGLSLSQSYTSERGYKDWGVVHWKVRDPSRYGRRATHNEALKTALGLNPGQIPISVWKAIPWTWLIDWFTDISNVLQANYNMVYYKPYRLSIMRTSFNNRSYPRIYPISGSSPGECTAGTIKVTYKERYVNNSPSASPTLRLPFLDNFKLSILGSLTILRISSKR
jgi:hypothetical protein